MPSRQRGVLILFAGSAWRQARRVQPVSAWLAVSGRRWTGAVSVSVGRGSGWARAGLSGAERIEHPPVLADIAPGGRQRVVVPGGHCLVEDLYGILTSAGCCLRATVGPVSGQLPGRTYTFPRGASGCSGPPPSRGPSQPLHPRYLQLLKAVGVRYRI